MKLYSVLKLHRGKRRTVFTGCLQKANDYREKMEASQRKGVKGQRVVYEIVEAAEGAEKYVMPPHKLNLSGQPRREGPPVIPSGRNRPKKA